MEGTFSYQLHDQVVLATPMIMPSQINNFNIKEFMFGNLSDDVSSFPHGYLSEALKTYQNLASPEPASNDTSVIDVKSDSSFPMAIDISQIGANQSPSDRRTRAKDGSSSRLISSEGKDSNGRRRKKQKREEERKQKEETKAKLEVQQEGYIHVRARRGQATDSHSLAERVRRKKLSERMTILQSLVPGCDKVSGKAHVLDVIINYVQSLQNRIEFLSMRLASMDQCMLSEYSFDQDVRMGGMTYEQVPRGGLEQQNVHNISELTERDIDDCLMMIYSDSSPSNLFQPQGLELDHTTAFSQAVGSANLGQFAEPGEELLNQVELDDIF